MARSQLFHTIRFDLQPGGAIGRSAVAGESSREYLASDKYLIPPHCEFDLPVDALLSEEDFPLAQDAIHFEDSVILNPEVA